MNLRASPSQPEHSEAGVSICPAGERFPLPGARDYEKELIRLRKLVEKQRREGREIVVVMGLGFVGAIMAGVVADSVNRTTGKPGMFVLGMQRPSTRSYWKIPYLQRGLPPVKSEDPEVEEIIRRCVLEKQTLSATFSYDALGLADVVVVDVQCDYVKDKLGEMRVGRADIAALEESFKIIGERIQPHCLVLIETTVPPGTTERIAYPVIKRAFEARGLTVSQKSEVRNQMSVLTTDHRPLTSDSAPYHEPSPIRNSQFEIPNSSALRPVPCVTTHSQSEIPPSPLIGQTPIRNSQFAIRNPSAPCPEPLLAHSYERVMPGRNYVASVRDFWRVCSGINAEARARVVGFLSEVLNVEQYPLTVMDRPVESETAKIVENSYRATILAFMDEWSRFAERHGVDINKVIQAIKVRPTHSNIMFPGPGIGGYCLPKDGALGQWGIRHLLGDEELSFPITTAAININDARGVHAAELCCDALAAMGRPVAGAQILICGASYREDVGDTRYSGSELIARRLAELAAAIRVHDPYLDHWYELESQDTYPAAGQSRMRFFRNQDGVVKIRVQKDLSAALKGVSAVILAVRHAPYLDLDPDWLVEQAGGPMAVIDCFGILSDEKIRRYLELGCEVKCLGRGHVSRIKGSFCGQQSA